MIKFQKDFTETQKGFLGDLASTLRQIEKTDDCVKKEFFAHTYNMVVKYSVCGCDCVFKNRKDGIPEGERLSQDMLDSILEDLLSHIWWMLKYNGSIQHIGFKEDAESLIKIKKLVNKG